MHLILIPPLLIVSQRTSIVIHLDTSVFERVIVVRYNVRNSNNNKLEKGEADNEVGLSAALVNKLFCVLS